VVNYFPAAGKQTSSGNGFSSFCLSFQNFQYDQLFSSYTYLEQVRLQSAAIQENISILASIELVILFGCYEVAPTLIANLFSPPRLPSILPSASSFRSLS
jgi:hypothetical protein